ncbi:putative prolyl-tRNA synthetase [Paraphysoderma sedebokerense]|nr:putative prolyl-tRNA synthetase [Paraphysoderma sedebokerense]
MSNIWFCPLGIVSCFINCHSLQSSSTHRNRLSKMFVPTMKENPTLSTSIASHRLMVRAGLIRQSASGIYSYLPYAVRALSKIEKIIDKEMQRVGGEKLSLPCLISSDLWKRTGKWDSSRSELFKLKDRKSADFLLSPTHEEEITNLIAQEVSSYRQLPLRLYQIGRKYRDELRPRSGLLRGREFIMKDMYSFDVTLEDAMKTYDEVLNAYTRIFDSLGVQYAVAEADSGDIGGPRSNEFHIISKVGEDTLLKCSNCTYTANSELAQDACPQCSHELGTANAIEVGHIFLLGTKYSSSLSALIRHRDSQDSHPIQMGCYGIGVSRLLAAMIESSHDERGIIFPDSIAPFHFVVVPAVSLSENPKTNQKEIQQMLTAAAETVYDALAALRPKECGMKVGSQENIDVLLDDRIGVNFGSKMMDATLIGYPFTVVVGKKFISDGMVEIQRRKTGEKRVVKFEDMAKTIRELAN